MEPVSPNRNLSRWKENETAKICPADVYKILRRWKDNGSFDTDHIAAIARDVALTLCDKIDGGEILYFDYDRDVGNSYEQEEVLSERYGSRVISIDEMRDSSGYLMQWRVCLSREEN